MSKKPASKVPEVGDPAGKDHPVYKDAGIATVTPVKKEKKEKKDDPPLES